MAAGFGGGSSRRPRARARSLIEPKPALARLLARRGERASALGGRGGR